MLKRSATDCDTHTLINAQRKNTENVWEIGENAHSCTGKKIRTDHHTFDNVLIQVPLSICTLFLHVVLYSFLFFSCLVLSGHVFNPSTLELPLLTAVSRQIAACWGIHPLLCRTLLHASEVCLRFLFADV